MATLFERIGDELIRKAITEFYRRAQNDGIIGHFFFGKDLADITAKQIVFASAMLGGPRKYQGKPLGLAHKDLILRKPHFDRRQMLMGEVLEELGLAAELKDGWLAMEERLRALIVNH